jgi:hypothetical protein
MTPNPQEQLNYDSPQKDANGQGLSNTAFVASLLTPLWAICFGLMSALAAPLVNEPPIGYVSWAIFLGVFGFPTGCAVAVLWRANESKRQRAQCIAAIVISLTTLLSFLIYLVYRN